LSPAVERIDGFVGERAKLMATENLSRTMADDQILELAIGKTTDA